MQEPGHLRHRPCPHQAGSERDLHPPQAPSGAMWASATMHAPRASGAPGPCPLPARGALWPALHALTFSLGSVSEPPSAPRGHGRKAGKEQRGLRCGAGVPGPLSGSQLRAGDRMGRELPAPGGIQDLASQNLTRWLFLRLLPCSANRPLPRREAPSPSSQGHGGGGGSPPSPVVDPPRCPTCSGPSVCHSPSCALPLVLTTGIAQVLGNPAERRGHLPPRNRDR